MISWQERYKQAHYIWTCKTYPAMVRDGHYCFMGMPLGIMKAKGLKTICCNFAKWTGNHLEPTNNVGIVKDNREIVTDVIGRKKQIGSIEYIRSGMELGTSDLKGHIRPLKQPYPVPVYVEIKANKDRMREEQIAYKERVTSTGAFHCIVKHPADFFEFYDYILSL